MLKMEVLASAEVKNRESMSMEISSHLDLLNSIIWQQNNAIALIAGIAARQAVSAGFYRLQDGVAKIDNKPRRSAASNP
jgi:hypothetical protein